MRRVSGRYERGATAVIVAILLVALFGFTALAVDLGAAWADKKQLQNGADAAALAIAQQCAAGSCPGSPNGEADAYAKANKFNATSTATGTAVIDAGAQQVTARAEENLTHWFAPVIGINSSLVAAEASAEWGWPVSGASLPMTLSWCDWTSQTGLDSGFVPEGGAEISLPLVGFKNKDPKCNRGAHNEIPGGFGFLNNTDCRATITGLGITTGFTGNTMKGDCTDEDWEGLQDATVVLPLFDSAVKDDAACDESKKDPCNITYTITGFAAIHITGYCLPTKSGGHVGWPAAKCSASKFGITGTFVNYASLSEGLELGDPELHYGASVVMLTG